MASLTLFLLLLLFTGTIGLIIWLYRPGSNTKKYDEYSNIPLEKYLTDEKKADVRRKKDKKNK